MPTPPLPSRSFYEALEERGVKYAVRIPANDSLERDIAELLTRPVGRPSHKPVVWYKGFLYQAVSWTTARRVVAKVEFHLGVLFPRVGFIVTNLETPSRAVVRFYNKRGTAKQWIIEGKQAVKMTQLSCHRFRCNEVRLGLSLLAYNLGNLWRRLALPKRIENWSLTSLQQRLVKTGGRFVKHARCYWLLLAESHLTRRILGSMLRRMAALPLTGWGPAGKANRLKFRERRRGVGEIASERSDGSSLVPRQGKSGLFWGVGNRQDEKDEKKLEAEAIRMYSVGHPGCQKEIQV